MNIGILGGTFNPIHNGHISMAQTAYNNLKLDKIILMPSGNPPHKSEVLDGPLRLIMTKLAVEEYPYMEVSDYEINKLTPSYTAETLTEYTIRYPNDNLVFIVGADSLVYMHEWYRPDIIFSLATVAVCVRSDTLDKELLQKKKYMEDTYNADIRLLDFEPVDVSSHEIRACISSGVDSDILNLVPAKVLDYIYDKGLYGSFVR